MKTEIILLAAGKGKRMKTSLPKVLLPLGGSPMVFHSLTTLVGVKPDRIHLVVGHGEAQLSQAMAEWKAVNLVRQPEQLGTGHAAALALKQVDKHSLALIMFADTPLVSKQTLRRLIARAQLGRAVWSVAELENPYGYGRILRDEKGCPCRIVEEKDCTPAERSIKEANMGILAASAGVLAKWLEEILAHPPTNTQREYILTDLMEYAYRDSYPIELVRSNDADEFLGANDMIQLAQLERILQKRRVEELAGQGVCFLDPLRVDIWGQVKAGRDVTIGPNVIFKGKVTLGQGVSISSHCVIEDCTIAAGTQVRDFCHLEGSRIGKNCTLGPFSRVRPQCLIEDEAHLGNFVETKKTHMGKGSKASHLTYLGNSKIGQQVNIGAGTITCNYDGVKKHLTVIKDDAFIGSNTALVAPVTIGKGATIGAGSVINKDVSDYSLAVERNKQQEIRRFSPFGRKKTPR